MVRRISNDDLRHASSLPEEGWHLVEVRTCEERTSQHGDPYFALTLADVSTGAEIVRDNCMLGGRGLPIGLKKLETLGGARLNEVDGTWAIDEPHTVVGRRAEVHVSHAPYDWKGDRRIGAKVTVDKGTKGYRRVESEPSSDAIPF